MTTQQPSYEELQRSCEDLRKTAARAISIKQELIETKQALDLELDRYRQIQRYVERVLSVPTISEFGTLTCEQLLESYGIEAALLFLCDPKDASGTASVVGFCGLNSCPQTLPFQQKWLTPAQQKQLSHHGPESLLVKEWTELSLQEIIFCPLHDGKGQLQGALLALRSSSGSDFYPELPSIGESTIGVLSFQAGALLRNLQATDVIHRQVAKLREALKRQEEETERRLSEERRNIQQERIIATQRETLHQLATPVMPIHDRVLAIPLIGAIDSERANRLLEIVLEQVQSQHAELVVLDVTGVPALDAEVAMLLDRITRAVRLLGAEIVLSGIRAEVAMRLVQSGVSLSEIRTTANFQSAVKIAFHRTAQAKNPAQAAGHSR